MLLYTRTQHPLTHTRPQLGGTRHITAADLELATRSLAKRTGAAAFREMSLRELWQRGIRISFQLGVSRSAFMSGAGGVGSH
eukprot:COSAG02_NODE_1558_length_11928_cov_4.044974_6_plen_82_part_00